jgi:hypothetical protein
MILYVNGDSHAAAAEAVNPYAFAEDDPNLPHLGRLPHPDNWRVAWPRRVSEILKYTLHSDCESASSNQRILRTTRSWLASSQRRSHEILLLIQWSTWERQEWEVDGQLYQVNASGIDHVPESHQQKYQQWIADLDWKSCTQKAHQDIVDFHRELQAAGVSHVFFNGNNHFADMAKSDQIDWGTAYLAPYDPKMTYNQWLLDHGHQTVSPKSWHFGAEAHSSWARFVLQYLLENQLVR